MDWDELKDSRRFGDQLVINLEFEDYGYLRAS